MLCFELKKLLCKQYALVCVLIMIACDVIYFTNIYAEKTFDSQSEKKIYTDYIQMFEGRLDEGKECLILSEQENIINAGISLKELQNSLYKGEFTDKSEYISEFMTIQNELAKSSAFDKVYSQYKYIKENPDNRYFIPIKNIGMCRDYPDVLFVLLVIAFSAQFFLDEESSNMIILIRSYRNKMTNAFRSKLTSLLLMIFIAQSMISFTEFVFLIKTIGNVCINYPVQSLEYFGGCPYNITILQAFLIIQLVKLLGVFFITELTVILAVTFKKPLVTVSIPTAACILQQFIFTDSSKSYYLPTGFLRAVGFLRGDAYETIIDYSESHIVKVFSEIPTSAFFLNLFYIFCFLIVAVIAGNLYYNGTVIKHKKYSGIVISMLILVLFTGCDDYEYKDVYYNIRTSSTLSQNEKYYFHQSYNGKGCGVTAVRLSDNAVFDVINDPFDTEYWTGTFCSAGNSLYILHRIGIKDFEIYEVNLDSFEYKIKAKQDTAGHSVFLGLKKENNIIIDKDITDFFTNGTDTFFVTEDKEVYRSDMKLNKISCIISDGIYNQNLVCNGSKICYINNLLELIVYDINTGKKEIISENFVTALDIDTDELVFSEKNGIYTLSLNSGVIQKIAETNADAISADSGKIVCMHNGSMYLINGGLIYELLNEPIISFSMIRGEDKIIYSRYNSDTESIDDFIIDISNYEME